MLCELLKQTVLDQPQKTALISKNSHCSYQELWSRSELLAEIIIKHGVQPGDRVGIIASNAIEPVIAWLAILKCGAICVYVNETLKKSGVHFIADDASPTLFLCGSSATHDLLPISARRINLDTIDWSDEYVNATDDCLRPNNDSESIASIVYTSGSTGAPKGVCLTQRNLLSSANIAISGHELTKADRYLMVVPLHYVHGQMMLLSTLLSGGSIEFMASFIFPTAVTKKLKDQNITGFSGVPYHFTALLDRGGLLSTPLPSLRWACVTGGALAPERILNIIEKMPTLEFHIGYGQTECSPRISRLEPARTHRKPTSIGSEEPGLTVEILNDEELAVPPGDTGELVVSGPSVMKGYWNDPTGTAKVIDQQGRLHTGDLAYVDEEGDIFIRGRRQAMIKSAGERIFPEELEAILIQNEEVAEVAVVGQPNELYGQVAEAHIVLREPQPELAGEALKRVETYCLEHMPFARSPRHYQLWSEFPVKANGKIDKQYLIENSIIDRVKKFGT